MTVGPHAIKRLQLQYTSHQMRDSSLDVTPSMEIGMAPILYAG